MYFPRKQINGNLQFSNPVWGSGAVAGHTATAVVLQLLTIRFKLQELFILYAILPQTQCFFSGIHSLIWNSLSVHFKLYFFIFHIFKTQNKVRLVEVKLIFFLQ